MTWGHVPKWLNVNHPKLNIVRHEDFIPADCLPVFNSNAIEINLHRIQGIAEHFVIFNDDTFLLQPIEPDLFFLNGLPRHPVWLRHIVPEPNNRIMPHIYLNVTALINRHFKACDSYAQHKEKWESPNVEPEAIVSNRAYLKLDKFPGFRNEHLPVPILKRTMVELWGKEEQAFTQTSYNRFRSWNDVSQYAFRYWQIVSGNYEPITRAELGQYYVIDDNMQKIYEVIESSAHPMICLNDMEFVGDEFKIEQTKKALIKSFDYILGEKSLYER